MTEHETTEAMMSQYRFKDSNVQLFAVSTVLTLRSPNIQAA